MSMYPQYNNNMIISKKEKNVYDDLKERFVFQAHVVFYTCNPSTWEAELGCS
jgi:hypothetical protein